MSPNEIQNFICPMIFMAVLTFLGGLARGLISGSSVKGSVIMGLINGICIIIMFLALLIAG